MQTLIEKERFKYERMWSEESYRYNSPATHLKPILNLGITQEMKEGERLIDFGCGTGQIAPFFLNLGLRVDLIDIASNALDPSIHALTTFAPCQFIEGCLWDLPKELAPAEWILCVDVLEHLPEEQVDAALFEMAKRTKRGGILQIYLEDEPFGDLIGETLHLCVKSHAWWVDKISHYWEIRLVSPPAKTRVRMIALLGKGKSCNLS